MTRSEGISPASCGQSGFTLIELVVVVVLLGFGTLMLGTGLLKKAGKRMDVVALKDMLTTASRRSLVEGVHYGVHYDSISGAVGLFEDENTNDVFDGVDTLGQVFRLSRGAKLNIIDSDSAGLHDVVFKKNGAVSADLSFAILYQGPLNDSVALQVFAASGRVMEGMP